VTFTAPNVTTLDYADTGFGSFSMTFATANMSGRAIVADPLFVPAVDAYGNASSVLPASAIFPTSSYAYQLTSTATHATPAYWIYADANNEVTTLASSLLPITQANFSAVGFAQHASMTDPICVGGYGLVYGGFGNSYFIFGLTLNAGVPAGSYPTCNNASIGVTAAPKGTYDVSFVSVMGTTVVTFSNPFGEIATSNPFGNYVVGVLPSLNKAYFGDVIPVGTSTTTSYWMNKTAMDAALQAWGVAPL